MLVLTKMNPDLVKERENASFNVEEFAVWFHGGAEKLKMKRFIEKEVFNDLDDPLSLEYLSHADLYAVALKQATKAAKKLKATQKMLNPTGTDIYPDLMNGPVGIALMPSGSPLYVHAMMFTSVIKGQGTTDLYDKFGKRAHNCEIIGAYAQTELGHGTFVRGLETRADYDLKTDEFVLNTPTLTSYKWWPGGLGHTANYCILVAQLYIKNKWKGVQLFLLQVRDEETHLPLVGIEIGEIGRKIAMSSQDNGYLGLKNVRIPRTQMLMKHAQVLADGSFVQSPQAQLNYFPMVSSRCIIAANNSLMLMQAATIATRYSAVRRQSPINPDEPEPQIMDHVTQQMKLFPEIATGIAYNLAAKYLSELHDNTESSINSGDYSRLSELHALACSMKVCCTYDSAFGIERLRQSCGGHGYLAAANLGNLFTLATVACTYEGENSVLNLQVGKILLKTWANVLAGKQQMPTMAYLSECAALKRFPKWTGSWACMVKALQYIATCKTRIAFMSFNDRLRQGLTQPEALNNTGIELTHAAELHGRSFVAHTFMREVMNSAGRSSALQLILEHLLEVYLLHTTLHYLSDFLRFIEITDAELTDIQRRLESVLSKIRPDAVAICDGFDFHDVVLSSVLGAYDGNVYERIFESAKKSPLNRKSVPNYFEAFLKPFMKSNL